jgi:hypothetical protein
MPRFFYKGTAMTVINMPTPMSVLADRIRMAYERTQKGKQEWIEGTIELAVALAEARGRYPADRNFAHWLVENDLDEIGKNDRSALIGMAMHLDITRRVLQETERLSWRYIWEEEVEPRISFQVPYVGKPDAVFLKAENPAPQASLVTIEPAETHEKKSPLNPRHPFWGLERAEEVAATFGNINARTGIGKILRTKGGGLLWTLILDAIDAGFLTPCNDMSRPPNLRTLFPGIRPTFATRFDFTRPEVLKRIRDVIMPIAIANREAVIADPGRLEAILHEDTQRQQREAQQASVEKKTVEAIRALPSNQSEVTMYGVRLWPRVERHGEYDYDQLRAAIWYWRDFNNWAGRSPLCTSAKSRAIYGRLSVRWFGEFIDRTGGPNPLKKVFSLVHLLAGLYEDNPEGECTIPVSPHVEGQW